VGGQFTQIGGGARNHIARLYPNGTLDATFNPNANSNVYSIAVQEDGKILVGGAFTTVGGGTRNKIARLNPDGTLDLDFDPNVNDTVVSIAVQKDGKILAGGDFTTLSGVIRNRIALLRPELTPDGILLDFNPNISDRVASIAVSADGKILVGGQFATIGGVTRNAIARLNPDGTLDMGFNPSANNTVLSIVVQADGKILVGGLFTTIGGVTRNHIAQLYPEGTVDLPLPPTLPPPPLSPPPAPPGANQPPSSPELVFPGEGERGLPTNITFKWNPSTDPDGDPITYTLCIREGDDHFIDTDCKPAIQTVLRLEKVLYAGINFSWLGLLLMGSVFIRCGRFRVRGVGLLLITGLLLTACSSKKSGEVSSLPAPFAATFTDSSLRPNMLYFWKVVAKDSQGNTTPSPTRSFTTA